jgi:hypothetical protein
VREVAKIILLEDHKVSDRPCQALEQNVIKLQIWNDKYLRSHSKDVEGHTVNFNLI